MLRVLLVNPIPHPPTEASMTTHRSFPNPDRPERWEGEEDHFRSTLQPGDLVRGEYGDLSVLVCWNNTWSHVRGGRIAHLEPVGPAFGHTSSWENVLTPGEPGDVGTHPCHEHENTSHGWVHVCASWQEDHGDRRKGCPHQRVLVAT